MLMQSIDCCGFCESAFSGESQLHARTAWLTERLRRQRVETTRHNNSRATPFRINRNGQKSYWTRGGRVLQLRAIIVWACLQTGLSCGGAPDVSTIQSAYELETGAGNNLHDSGRRVIEAKCHDHASQRVGEKYLREVKFISTSDPTERLYFNIVAMARSGDKWKLASGLCKR
jgi:hypothetical protein